MAGFNPVGKLRALHAVEVLDKQVCLKCPELRCAGLHRPKRKCIEIVDGRATGVGCPKWCEVGKCAMGRRAIVSIGTDGNLVDAIQHRVLLEKKDDGGYGPVTKPKPEVFKRRMSKEAASLRKASFALKGVQSVLRPDTLLEYASKWYTGRKLVLYARAALECVAGMFRVLDSWVEGFVKIEKHLTTALQDTWGWLVEPSPKEIVSRFISPRRPRYNVMLGRYLKKIEGLVYHELQFLMHSSRPVVMKGFNCFETGAMFHDAWDSYQHPCALGLDASRFDQHVSRDALCWEHSIYAFHYTGSDRRELQYLLDMQLRNHCRANGDAHRYSWEMDGGRCSGDMNTALGNCLLMVSMMHCFLRECNIPEHAVSLFDNGDDCVIIAEKDVIDSIAPKLKRYFIDFGFVMKIETPVCVLEEVEFCQTHPVFDGARWRMVRGYPDCTAKDAVLLHCPQEAKLVKPFLNALRDCGLAICSGLPIMQDLYCSLTDGVGARDWSSLEGTGMMQMSKGLPTKCTEVSTDCRISFWRAFGVTPDQQRYRESTCRALPLVSMNRVSQFAPTSCPWGG